MRIKAGTMALPLALSVLLVASPLLGGCVGSITPPSSGQNSAPVANAGADQKVAVATQVTLNGGASLDPDNNPLTYSWTLTSQPAGSKAALSHGNEAVASFVPDLPGTYVASLVVSDGKLSSAASKVTITATAATDYSANVGLALAVSNATPAIGQTVVLTFTVTNAGPDTASSVSVSGGLPMGLDYVLGSPAVGSYDPVINEWKIGTLAAGASATMSLALTLTSPVQQTYSAAVFSGTKDPSAANDHGSVTIGTSQPVTACEPWTATAVFTAGQCTIYQGNIYTAKWWTQGEVPGSSTKVAWSLYGPVGGTAVTAPLCPAWQAALVFTIGHCTTYQNSTYYAKWTTQGDVPGASQTGPWQPYTSPVQPPAQNTAPTANAGADQKVAVATQVTLNGSASSDPDNNPLTYSWTLTSQPAGSKAALSHASEAIASFVPDLPGTYVASLVVSDGKLSSAASKVTITATAATDYSANLSLALAASNATPAIGQTIVLNFTVANAGPDTASSVSVSGGLPMGLDYVLASPAVGSYDPVINEWKIGTLAAGASATMSLALTLTSPVPQTYGAVVVAGTKDSNAANDRASVTLTSTQQISNCTDWTASATYGTGQCVNYQGNVYMAKWWTQGEVPGSSPNVAWSLVAPIGGTATAGPLCPAWERYLSFNSGHCTIYQNNTYFARWWTQSELPGAGPSGPWQLYAPAAAPAGAQCPAWKADALFITGQCATYQGYVYKSNWWTRGDVPSGAAGGAWTLVGPAGA